MHMSQLLHQSPIKLDAKSKGRQMFCLCIVKRAPRVTLNYLVDITLYRKISFSMVLVVVKISVTTNFEAYLISLKPVTWVYMTNEMLCFYEHRKNGDNSFLSCNSRSIVCIVTFQKL